MKEFLYGWIRDIAFYSLLMAVVLHVLPERGKQKYLRFFMGIVLILVVMSPILSATGLDTELDELYVSQTYDEELEAFLEKQENLENEYQERLNDALKQAEEEQAELQEKLEQEGQKGEEIEIPSIEIDLKVTEED